MIVPVSVEDIMKLIPKKDTIADTISTAFMII